MSPGINLWGRVFSHEWRSLNKRRSKVLWQDGCQTLGLFAISTLHRVALCERYQRYGWSEKNYIMCSKSGNVGFKGLKQLDLSSAMLLVCVLHTFYTFLNHISLLS